MEPRPPSTEKRGVEFFGRITASVTHEINNVFAIINENAGLLSDWLAASEQGGKIDPEGLRRVTEAIQKQVTRGKETAGSLNKFSHSVDAPEAQADLDELLSAICAVSQRFAYRKNVALEWQGSGQSLSVRTKPFILAQFVFESILLFLDGAAAGQSIQVALNGDQGAVIEIKGPPVETEEPFPDATLAELARELGCEIETDREAGAIRLAIEAPDA